MDRVDIDHSVVCPVLIGRSAPLSTVVHTLDRARSAHGSTLLVSGEAGIGKSRLAHAMVDEARARGFLVLQGACFETDRAHPYAPVLDLVRGVATSASAALAAHYFAPAANELVTLSPELRSIFPEAAPRATPDPEDDRRRLFHALNEAVAALARVQPVLLVIEDVHWSDDATLDLVLYLARQIGTSSIALVLTFRSDELGPRLAKLLADFDRARCASEIALRPLNAMDVASMLHAIFGTETTFGPAFVEGLHGLTEGNPFFVEEMLKSLMMAGDLTHADGAWRARPLEHVRVPRTATEAVGRRLAGLSAAARDVASVAAVAGRRFDFALLQVLTQYDERELLSLVKELVEAQLVVEESADRFAFRHALVREAMRARLLARERVALHRSIAAALEAEYDRGIPDLEDSLAYHAFEAGMWDRAREFALRAATRAFTLCAPREGLEELQRAVMATERSGHRADVPLLMARGRAHETLGAFSLANEDFTTALAIARANTDQRGEWDALHALGMLWAARDFDAAGRYRRDALRVARSIDDPILIAHSLNRVGNWHVNGENPRAGIPNHDEALAIFERAGDRRGVAESVDLLGMAHHIGAMQDAAAPLLERAVELFALLEDRRGMTNSLAVLSVCGPSYHASSGPARKSIHTPELLNDERASRLASEIGWRAGEAFSRFLLADCVAWRGEYARALRTARESLVIAEEIDNFQWQCGARRVLGTLALDLCACPEAIAQLSTAHDIARRLASLTWIRWTGSPFAIALARAGQTERASSVLDEVDRLVTTTHDTLGGRQVTVARAEVALAAGEALGAWHALDGLDASRAPRAALLRARISIALERWGEATAWLEAARREALDQDAHSLTWRIEAACGAVALRERRRLDARAAFDAARVAAEALIAGLDEPSLLDAFRAELDVLAPPAAERTRAQLAKATHGGLTKRERDTAALIAQGKSNRAIARALGIGERTVEGYVAAALAKLGYSSRAQVAVWASEQGLSAPDSGTGKRRR